MKKVDFKKYLIDNYSMNFSFGKKDINFFDKKVKKHNKVKNKKILNDSEKEIQKILKLSGIKKEVGETRGDEYNYDYGNRDPLKKVKKEVIDAYTFTGGLTPEFKISGKGDNPLHNPLNDKFKKNHGKQ